MTCAFYSIVYDIVFLIERKINYFILFYFLFYYVTSVPGGVGLGRRRKAAPEER